MKLLAVGDLHVGRRPSKLPESLRARSRELGPAGALTRIVELALREEVDAVVFAGDVVENDKDFFEAYRELYSKIALLSNNGVQVFGVVGNHDALVLPRLQKELPAFRLLGLNGNWECVEITDGAETISLWGWSFPRSVVTENPLANCRFKRGAGVNVGVLHCDLDQRVSRYAPVSRGELAGAGMDAWLLGHIHRPDELSLSSPIGYLGSALGLDPGEHGLRGPWLVRVNEGALKSIEQWNLAPLHWEELELDISGVSQIEEARNALIRLLKTLDARMANVVLPPEALGLRIRIVGRSALGTSVQNMLEREDEEVIYVGEQGTVYFIEKIYSLVEPELAMDSLAERSDPAGLLARRLLLLSRPPDTPERKDLIKGVKRKMELVNRDSRWNSLNPPEPDDELAAKCLYHAGLKILEIMLAEKDEAK